MTNLGDLGSFSRLVAALSGWLDRVVIIGGWAHRLYRLHPYAQAVEYAPLTTLDTDVAIPAELPTTTENIRQRLLAQGFTEEFLGDDRPPATHYRLGDEASGFYAEFLTPLRGSGYDRMKTRKSTARIAGVTSQRLRYIDILLIDPWAIEFDLIGAAEERKMVQIANPACFLAQKILIHSGRSREKRAKDILYIHDTLEVFGGRLEALNAEWESRIAPRLHGNHVKVVRKASDRIFGGVTDTIRDAAIMAAGRDLNPESVREACQFGLRQLFG
jgi:hypothetical protein